MGCSYRSDMSRLIFKEQSQQTDWLEEHREDGYWTAVVTTETDYRQFDSVRKRK